MPRRSRGGLTSLPTIPPLISNPAREDAKGGVKRYIEAFLDDEDLAKVRLSPSPPKKKRVSRPRKPSSARFSSKLNPYPLNDDEAHYDDNEEIQTPRATQRCRRTASDNTESPEKRQRKYRSKPPQTFLTKLSRARTQRMIVLSRTRTSDVSEDIAIVGSTGNIYTVTVDHVPSCTCPDHQKGNECKHKVYALHTVLKATEHLVYQLALLSDELKTIFANAPPIPNADKVADNDQDAGSANKRKPFADTECPICYMDMLPSEDLVWCKAACGNNMHKSCFDQWIASQRGQTVRCVYCRTPWTVDVSSLAQLQVQGYVGQDGYINVAAQLGMDEQRDYSGYHQPWVRRRMYRGSFYDDE